MVSVIKLHYYFRNLKAGRRLFGVGVKIVNRHALCVNLRFGGHIIYRNGAAEHSVCRFCPIGNLAFVFKADILAVRACCVFGELYKSRRSCRICRHCHDFLAADISLRTEDFFGIALYESDCFCRADRGIVPCAVPDIFKAARGVVDSLRAEHTHKHCRRLRAGNRTVRVGAAVLVTFYYPMLRKGVHNIKLVAVIVHVVFYIVREVLFVRDKRLNLAVFVLCRHCRVHIPVIAHRKRNSLLRVLISQQKPSIFSPILQRDFFALAVGD